MAKASIPNVLGNYLELPNGDVVEADSAKWFDTLADSEFRSFRFEDGASPYTCRKEKVKGIDGYWYGYQRVSGKVTKRYIGKTSDITQAKLIEVSERFQALPKKSFRGLGNTNNSTKLPNWLGNDLTTMAQLHNSSNGELLGKLPGELPGELLSKLPGESLNNLPNRLGCESFANLSNDLQAELEAVLIGDSLDNLLGELIWKFKDEVAQLKAEKRQLEHQLTECREQLEQKSEVSVSQPVEAEPAQLLNQLRQQNKRTKTTLRDVEDILSLVAGD